MSNVPWPEGCYTPAMPKASVFDGWPAVERRVTRTTVAPRAIIWWMRTSVTWEAATVRDRSAVEGVSSRSNGVGSVVAAGAVSRWAVALPRPERDEGLTRRSEG